MEDNVFVVITTSIFWVVVVLLVFTTNTTSWHNEAINRGYALYCPLDGEFAWKGECDK